MKRASFVAITLAVPAAFLVLSLAVILPKVVAGLRPYLLQYMQSKLTTEERNAIYQQIAQGGGFWDVVPDPDVAGLGQRNRTLVQTGAQVRVNNAGMRAARNYSAKPKGVFRILCLGDSFVFGMGAPEEDRFCDQLEAFYHEHKVTVAGQPIEAYAVGLPGWTLVQETTYLGSTITNYDPDVIILLSVANDITDDFGVNGVGSLTPSFSPEQRALGSAVFSNQVNVLFGDAGRYSALAWDLSPESRRRWDKAMERLRRLVELQQGRGKHILVSAMAWGPTDKPDEYPVLFQSQYIRRGIPAPFVMASFLPSPRTTLKHDTHPNRLGHGLLRDQYVHALHGLGWVTVPDTALPHLNQRTPVRLNPTLDLSRLSTFRQRYLTAFGETIDFTALRPDQTLAFLGGLFPESWDAAHALEAEPWASLKAAFLLRRPKDRPLKGVEVEINIPRRPELFPFSLTLLLDGVPAAQLRFAQPNQPGHYRVSGAPSVSPFNDQVVEVGLETNSYFTTIDDARMKSYRLVRAHVF